MELSSLTLKFFVTMNIRIISLIDAAFDDPFLDLICASKMSAKEPGRKNDMISFTVYLKLYLT